MSDPKYLDSEHIDLPDMFIKKFHLKTVTSSKEIYYYDSESGIYRNNGDILIKESLEADYLSQLEEFKKQTNGMTVKDIKDSRMIPPEPWSKKAIDEFLGHVERRTYIDVSELNHVIEWLACEDCMLNLKTGKTALFDPKYLNTTQIPVKYDIAARTPMADFYYYCIKDPMVDSSPCPQIMKFLNGIMGPEDVDVVLDFIAYCLWREYRFHKWLLLNGAGQNGKSTLLTIIERFLGAHNVSAESLYRLQYKQFSPAGLYHKLVNVDADLSGDMLSNSGILKKLTGNDEFPGENKNKTPFKFRNYAKLIFSCNEYPEFHDKTDAFFRRLIIINFTQQFFGDKEDHNLIDKLTTEEELSGLLYELMIRLPRILEKGLIQTTNTTMRDTYDKYIRGSNIVKYFTEKYIIPGADKVSITQMYESYLWFCKANKLSVESEQSFSRKMLELGYQKNRSRVGGVRDYYWENIKLIDWMVVEDKSQGTLDGNADEGFTDTVREELK
jgi:P4 family phage/plasmid primase-like protien